MPVISMEKSPARRSLLTARIFFSPSSATQGHQPFTVFCSKRDTNRSGWRVSSSWSTEHFSAVLAGLGMRLRSSCREPVAKKGALASSLSHCQPRATLWLRLHSPSITSHSICSASHPSVHASICPLVCLIDSPLTGLPNCSIIHLTILT